jgi:hypothetical protein
LIAAAISAVPKLTRNDATTRGSVANAQISAGLIAAARNAKPARGSSTIRPR